MLHENYVVQGRDYGEHESRPKKDSSAYPYPAYRLHFKEKHEEYGADLRKGIGLAENAGAEIPQSGDRKQNGAGGENRDIAAENENRELPWNLVENRKDKKQRAEQEFVGDGIKVLAEQRLLMKPASKQAIKAITEASDDKKNESPEIVSVQKIVDNERNEEHPHQGELIGSSEDLRELHAGSLEGCGLDC